MKDEIMFTRAASIAARIDRELQAATQSIDAALYRLNSPRLIQALKKAARRGTSVRLVLDRDKYMRTPAIRPILGRRGISFRLSRGRRGRWSKMHHKFAILDSRTVLMGSFNWTVESEEYNHEALLIIRERPLVRSFVQEFEELWRSSAVVGKRSAPEETK
jgi:phosphatidylserine/phosphatidylglycerophosphate/cardiolipin synthase-like enzyme